MGEWQMTGPIQIKGTLAKRALLHLVGTNQSQAILYFYTMFACPWFDADRSEELTRTAKTHSKISYSGKPDQHIIFTGGRKCILFLGIVALAPADFF